MQRTVYQLAAEVVQREGGFVDDPADRGGATNFGVSLRYAKGIGLDLDGDQDTDIEDIKLVTAEKAVELYIRDFFVLPGYDKLPACLHAQMMDIAVNSGAARATLILQEVCEATVEPGLKLDGKIGQLTRTAAARLVSAMGGATANDALSDQRALFLMSISRGSNYKFRDGWLRRAAEFRSAEPDWLPPRFRKTPAVVVAAPPRQPPLVKGRPGTLNSAPPVERTLISRLIAVLQWAIRLFTRRGAPA